MMTLSVLQGVLSNGVTSESEEDTKDFYNPFYMNNSESQKAQFYPNFLH